jgi:hypothetical protein
MRGLGTALDSERMFDSTAGMERTFAARMFVEHEFSVKHPGQPLSPALSHLLGRISSMTATLTLSPSSSVSRRVPRATYRRRRLVAAAIAFGLTASVLLLAARIHHAQAGFDGPPAPGPVYVVQPGDTLWSIAGTLAPGVDTRRAVGALRSAAGGSDLVPGQRITVPSSLRR